MAHGSIRQGGDGGRFRLPVLLAIASLLIQALLPAAAMAAQRTSDGQTVMICTQMGVQVVTVGADGKALKGGPLHKGGFAGLPCQDCVAASTAALPAPQPMLLPVAYVVARVEHAPARRAAPQLARAPPRPPGQGPPLA